MARDSQCSKNNFILNTAEIAYYLYFAVMTFAKGIGLYDGMWPYTAALLLGALLAVIKLALTEHTVAEWIYILCLIILGIVVWYNSGEKGALIYITMIVAMKRVPVKRLFVLGLAIWGSTFVAQAVLTITGIKSDIFVIHPKLGLGYVIRWSLGYPHPNVLQITCMMLTAFILYLADLKGKKLVRATLLLLLANLYVFLYSVSYTGLILCLVYLFGNLYLSFRKELVRVEKVLVSLVFPACVTFAVLGPVVFQGKLWEICNKILNMRFFITKQYLTLDPLTLFGARPSEKIPINFLNIDSSYVFALMHYGLVIFGLLCVGYMALIHHCIKRKKYKELAIVIAFSIAAITEPFFVNPSFKNISLLFLGAFVFEKFEAFSEKKRSHFLNRKFILCPLGKRNLEIPVEYWMQLKDACKQVLVTEKKRILISALCSGMIAGILFAVCADMPSGYYALRSSTQREEPGFCLDINELPEDFDGKILNYKDAETLMIWAEGNIVTVEYIRGIVSSTLWCSLSAALIVSGVLCIRKRQTSHKA